MFGKREQGQGIDATERRCERSLEKIPSLGAVADLPSRPLSHKDCPRAFLFPFVSERYVSVCLGISL